jgi:hypothetical protein
MFLVDCRRVFSSGLPIYLGRIMLNEEGESPTLRQLAASIRLSVNWSQAITTIGQIIPQREKNICNLKPTLESLHETLMSG